MERMMTRRFKKMEEDKSQEPNPDLLRRFDAKNFVRIDQSLLTSLDNFKAGEQSEVEAINSAVNKSKTRESLSSTPNRELPGSSKDSASEEKEEGTTPRSGSTSRSGYSLRRSKRRPARFDGEVIESETPPKKAGSTKKQEHDQMETEGMLEEDEASTSTNPANIQSARGSEEMASSSPVTPVLTNITKGRKPLKPMSLPTTESRKIRFGWYLTDIGSMPVISKEDKEFAIVDPDEYVCSNEKKAWAGEYMMCIGQKNLCKWM